MIIHPRHKWTTRPCSENLGADHITDLPFYRRPLGISFHSTPHDLLLNDIDPAKHFAAIYQEDIGIGYSDIQYNLGVAGNVDGVWNLRGLQNKCTVSVDFRTNAEVLAVYVSIGRWEKPSDTLLRNIVDARRLVHSRYVLASRVIDHTHNPYLNQLFTKKGFWEGAFTPPVGNFPAFSLPATDLSIGQNGVNVQDLQEQLAFWGYYRVRVTGVFNTQTQDAVTALQADLKDGGYYHYGLDGVYTDHLRRAWLKFLEACDGGQNG